MQRRKILASLILMLALVVAGNLQTDYVWDLWDYVFGFSGLMLILLPVFWADAEIGSGSGSGPAA